VEQAPLALPVYKQPGDLLEINIYNKGSSAINVSVEFDNPSAFTPLNNCAGAKTLSPGDNFCRHFSRTE